LNNSGPKLEQQELSYRKQIAAHAIHCGHLL